MAPSVRLLEFDCTWGSPGGPPLRREERNKLVGTERRKKEKSGTY